MKEPTRTISGIREVGDILINHVVTIYIDKTQVEIHAYVTYTNLNSLFESTTRHGEIFRYKRDTLQYREIHDNICRDDKTLSRLLLELIIASHKSCT